MQDSNFERRKTAHVAMHLEKSHRQMLFMSFVKLNANLGITWEDFVNMDPDVRDELILYERIASLREAG